MKQVNIISSLTFSDESVAIEELYETGYSKELGIAMQAHQVLLDHESLSPLTLHLLEGLVQFVSDGDSCVLGKGDILTLDAGVKHNLEAIENSLIRLTLFTGIEGTA